jgi:hypothetical protein
MKKLLLSLCLVAVMFSATPVFAQTPEPLTQEQLIVQLDSLKQQLIAMLLEQIASLQAQIAVMMASQVATGNILTEQSQAIQAQGVVIQEIKVNTPPLVVKGCMDSKASNYNALATESGVACVYPALSVSCSGSFPSNYIRWTAQVSGGKSEYQYGWNCGAKYYDDGTFTINSDCQFVSDSSLETYPTYFNVPDKNGLSAYDSDGDGIIPNIMRVFVKSGNEVKYSLCPITL